MIKKVIFFVVGLGIWFLFVSKVIFKEMVIVVDCLVIEYVIKEVVVVGIE